MPRVQCLPVALSLVCCAGAAFAQQFRELPRRAYWPEETPDTRALAIADVDGNGWEDVALGSAYSGRLFLGTGAGRFVDGGSWEPAQEAKGFGFGDFDRDRDADVLVVGRTSARAYRNDGGTFVDVTASILPSWPEVPVCLVVFDADGDGDLDAVFGNEGQSRLLRNDGTGHFSDVTSKMLPLHDGFTAAGWAAADVDGDRDLDLVVAVVASSVGRRQNRLYRNEGGGRFEDVTDAAMPVDADASRGVFAADFDGDRDIDLVFANQGTQDRCYANDGDGVFKDVTALRMPVMVRESRGVDAADLDGDGDLDLVFAETRAWADIRVYWNEGGGVFGAAGVPGSTGLESTAAVLLADVDRDGDRDLLVGNDREGYVAGSARLFLGDGRGTLVDVSSARLAARYDLVSAGDLGDLDGDGDLDLVLAWYHGSPLAFLNDGTGCFAVRGSAGGGGADPTDLRFGDLDGDGDLDMVETGSLSWRHSGINAALRNDGMGNLQYVSITSVIDRTATSALGDVDGDGDLDIFFANVTQQNRLLRNDGGWVFPEVTASQLPGEADATYQAAFGDVDGDRDLDLVLANDGQNKLYANNGSGTFTDVTAGRLPAATDASNGVALADFDADGDLDIAFANAAAGGAQSRVYTNDGRGVFTDVTATHCPVWAGYAAEVHAGDLDDDGDVDLLFTESSLASSTGGRLWLNDGAGRFADGTDARFFDPAGRASLLRVGDVDRDGDHDVVRGDGGRAALLLDLHRQMAAPTHPALGETYRLLLVSKPGYAFGPTLVVPALAAAAAPAPISVPGLGEFFLAVPDTIVLPILTITNVAVSLELPVPNVPELAGSVLWSQALFVEPVPGGARLHFGSVLGDRVLN